MKQPRSLAGLPAPLFEKLTDLSPNSAEDDQDLIFQTQEAATRSIVREVARLLDTRLPWPKDDGESRPPPLVANAPVIDRSRTVLAYGLPDLTHLCIRNLADRRAIERMVTDAIRAFEPRLEDPRVTIEMTAEASFGRLEISGNVRMGRSLEPLAFGLETNLRLEGEARRKMAAAAKNARR